MTGESFLSRWSRLKQKEAEPRRPEPEPESAPPLPAVAEPEAPPAEVLDDKAGEDALADLPPVDSLTAESDFTPFLRAGVPEDLHRQALRKLWTSDPVFANDDGLKDYADDYTGLFKGAGIVKTAYRVGKGFLDAAEEVAERAEEAAAASVDESGTPSELVEDPDGERDMAEKS
ncbi:DUF3306 domain-containing protein [Azospirillum sp. sgz301742]